MTYLVFTLPGEYNLATFMLLMYCFVTIVIGHSLQGVSNKLAMPKFPFGSIVIIQE